MSLTHRTVVRELRRSLGPERTDPVLRRSLSELDRMLDRVDDRGSPVVRSHAKAWIVPVAALYVALRDELGDQERALGVTFGAMTARATNRARALRVLRWLPGRFAIFRLAHRRALAADFCAPGWDCEIIENSPTRLAYTMHSCCYTEIFHELGVPEVAPLSCRMDDADYALLPEVRFQRTKTLAGGDECCDFSHHMEKGSG